MDKLPPATCEVLSPQQEVTRLKELSRVDFVQYTAFLNEQLSLISDVYGYEAGVAVIEKSTVVHIAHSDSLVLSKTPMCQRDNSLAALVVSHQIEHLCISDIEAYPELSQYADARTESCDMISYLGVPIFSEYGFVIAVLYCYSQVQVRFEESALKLLKSIAQRITNQLYPIESHSNSLPLTKRSSLLSLYHFQ